jgi:hypothetical protein
MKFLLTCTTHVLLSAVVTTAYAAPPATSAYLTDPQSSYVQDATSQSIGQVNMIACIMYSMRPDALVNQGPYVALVDQNVCNSGNTGAATSGATAGAAQAPNYMTAVVSSTRASNSDPMLVSAWLSVSEQGTPKKVFAHISATQAASASNPYGAFRMDYCGKANGTAACIFNGFMQAGNGTLSYYEADSSPSGSSTTALELTSVGTASGSGSLASQQSGGGGSPQSMTFGFAYDQTYFLRDDTQNGPQCFSRDAADPTTGFAVWQYGLYDATSGARIARNSGFPIQYTAAATTYQGYAGYYGLSLQGSAPIPANGSTVQKVDYQNGGATTTNYTVVTNGGRLNRYTKQTRSLQSIDRIHFNVFVNNAAPLGLPQNNAQYDMYWDDTTRQFIADAQINCSQNGCNTSNLAQVVAIAPSAWTALGGVQGWSQSLGGNLFINLAGVSGAINSATITVVYYVQDLVYPDDATVPATLYCVNNCPSAASLGAYFSQGAGGAVASPFTASTYNSYQPVLAANVAQYSVSGAVLTDGMGQAVVDTNPSDYQNYPQYQSGVMSGNLFASLADAVCPDNASPADYCGYMVNNLASVYYVWQTGPSPWSQFAALKDGTGSFVHFDAPLDVNFAVPNGAAFGSYAGTSIVLQYNAFGDLWGIPGTCVSSTTNLPVDCSTAGSRYVPDFVIPFDPTSAPQQGVVTASVNGVNTTYLVKWLQREIRLGMKATSVCTNDSLTAPSNVQLPTQASLTDPSSSNSPAYLGVEPSITSAPRVIQGVVKY